MTVTNVWVGATTGSTARVVAKVSSTAAVRIAIDTEPELSAPVFHGPVTPTAQGIASVTVTGLDPLTTYHFAVEHDSVLDTSFPGQFRTHPPLGQPATVVFGSASCAGASPITAGTGDVLADNRLSNHTIFDTIRDRALTEGWAFFSHLGDIHYYDLGSGNHGITGGASLANYRRAYDDVLLQPRQHELYRSVATVYAWDDHDYGPDNSDGTHTGKDAAAQAYRERVPHYPLPDENGPIYQSFQIGRVLFIVGDVRFDRDPNSDPQTDTKTLLGGGQKQWMQNVLATSGAAFCVWLLPERAWHIPAVSEPTSGTDHFGGFTAERNELVDMFSDLGWADRMLIVNGDFHHNGLNTGGHPFGGMPVYQFAALDSGPSSPTAGLWDAGSSGNRHQYGTVEIADGGGQITVTGRAYTGDTVVATHTFTVTPEEPPPPPPPAPAPTVLPAGTVSPVVTWLGCDLVTGRIVAELPDMTGEVSRLLGAYTTTHLQLPIPRSGRAALGSLAFQATVPGRSLIVAVVNDQPAWGGIVMPNNAGTGPVAEIGCVTLEGYLRRRRVRDHQFTQADEAEIMAALAGDAGPRDIPGLGLAGGIGLEIDAPPTGTLRDREYLASDRATVYDRMRELSAVNDGPEWTVELLWGDDTNTWVRKVLRVRKRIGVQSAAPAAIFETTAASVFSSRGSSEASYIYGDDYTRGATWVEAYSVGEGEDQPSSAPAIATDLIAGGFPIYERHWMPSSSITDVDTLNAHAQRDLAIRRNGSRTWEITARWSVYPRLNVDWRLGDDIAWRLVGHRHPDGVVGQGRAIGWVLDPQAGVVTPILLDPTSDEGEG